MKKLIYVLLFLMAYSYSNATTYYWIGGTAATSFNSKSYWTTDPVGRAAVGATGAITIGLSDVFIIDGTNVSSSPVLTGPVTITFTTLSATPFAQLKLVNGANVNLGRATSGSSVIDLKGDGTSAPDLVIDATSTLTAGSANYDFNVQLIVDTNATALISGNVYLSPAVNYVHTRSYITSKAAGNVVFATGAQCYISDSSASSGFNASVEGGIVFQSNSSLYYYTGRSPVGSSSTLQITKFESGSNLYFRGSNVSYVDGVTAYSSSSWVNAKFLANVFIQNGATFTADGAAGKIENLTIDAGCTFTTYKSGQTPILGNLTVNGILNSVSPSTNSIVMGGNTAQTITGSGSIIIPSLLVCDNSNVTLSKNIIDSVSTIVSGKLDLGINGSISGPSTFTSKVGSTAQALIGNLTAGSNLITNVVGTITGVNGLTVSGSGIPANANVVAFSSSGATITMSLPATATSTADTLNFAGKVATLSTANPNGFDSTNGCIKVAGIKSFQSGTNYIINAATVHPIGISSIATTNMNVGNITLNAPVTTNFKTTVLGTLTLNTGKLVIRPVDTLRIASGNDIAGGLFSNTKYIVTDVSGSNVGVLRIDSFTSAKLFPVGTLNDFLPITFNPADTASFAVSAFTGVTTNANPSGTSFTSTAKSSIVDAVWNVSRIKGVGNVSVGLNWPQSLEGNKFTAFSNTQIGISKYDSTLGWTTAIDSLANNTINTAVATFSGFTSFSVGQINVALPVRIKNVAASLNANTAAISWQVENEINIASFIVEKSANGVMFNSLGTVKALNNSTAINNYNFNDPFINAINNYYRIKLVGMDGSVKYSYVLLVKNSPLIQVQAYPNPVKAKSPVTIAFNANISSLASISVVDMSGKIISSVKSTIREGANTISIETGNNMMPGNYIISIILNNNQDVVINVPVIVN